MSRHQQFDFKIKNELLEKAENLGVMVPYSDSLSNLFNPITIGLRNVPNRLAVQPMEGFDADPDGSPSALTLRRYTRYAEGGSGLIWFEATGVIPEGRSNPYQLMISSRSLSRFENLVMQTRKAAYRVYGNAQELFTVLQLTHSGRYSKPEGKSKPVIAVSNPFLEGKDDQVHIIKDDELDRLQDHYVKAARLAREAGFDAVDIKSCHGYLINELLAAYAREKSRYGGAFSNRISFLLEVIQKIHDRVPGLDLAVRLNAYDGIHYPYGFGVSKDGSLEIDLKEPKELIQSLGNAGCSLINITAGNPYYNAHISRPFDQPVSGTLVPEEHPLEGIARLIKLCGELQKDFPYIPFVGTGFSWLRSFFPHVGAAAINRGKASIIGLGRSSLAYPDAPRDLMKNRKLDSKKVCIACSKCSELMRAGCVVGCVTRDSTIYGKEHKKNCP